MGKSFKNEINFQLTKTKSPPASIFYQKSAQVHQSQNRLYLEGEAMEFPLVSMKSLSSLMYPGGGLSGILQTKRRDSWKEVAMGIVSESLLVTLVPLHVVLRWFSIQTISSDQQVF